MSKRVTIAKAATAALAGVVALAAGAAAAQTAPYAARSENGYHYDPCRRDAAQRGTAGALIGGGMGAVIGSNAAARNARTEGALLGGLLGAIAGGVIGNKTAACTSAPPPPPPVATNYETREPYYDRDAYAAADAARDDAWKREDAWADHRRRVEDRAPDAGDCTLAESPIYMPDGRTQSRFVRVCRDASGRYAVVD
jgi:hypothetical protein